MDQTINIAGTSASNGLRLWRVIDIHRDGSVDAVSEYVSQDLVYFQGATGLKAYKVGTTTYVNYWLASRRYDSFYFCVRCVNSSGNLNSAYVRYLNNGTWKNSMYGYFLRPIITLKSGITTSGESGTKVDPYPLS